MNNETIEPRTLKTGKCKSLSGKSELTYEIRFTPEADIEFRILANSSSGFFSDEWVSLKRILKELNKVPAGEITCFTLEKVIKGKSINTTGFLLAALKGEGLVEASDTKRRSYQAMAPDKFFAKVQAILDKPAPKPKAKRVRKTATAS